MTTMPMPDRLPPPDIRAAVEMRDGMMLDTYVWLPKGEGPAPAILIRTPYSVAVTQVNDPPMLRCIAAGYALVMQQIRGVGASQGHFTFLSPYERSDGYDAVEWIAAQPWCTGAVGMDGHSYAGMTQLYAAAARPPHLRCIAPAVVSIDPFAEPPYVGGVFSRMHALVWLQSTSFTSHLDEEGGAFAFSNFLADPAVYDRWTSRPVNDAADGELTGDALDYYHDALAHPVLDDWWRERILSDADYAAMDLPVFVVSGNFDPSVGTWKLWRGLEANAANPATRSLIIGPWDHNGSFNGGAARTSIFAMDDSVERDLVALRIAFFNRYLKGDEDAAVPDDRVTLFVTGANEWRTLPHYPAPIISEQTLYLASDGHANSASGNGRLTAEASNGAPDHFVDDPHWPFYDAISGVKGPDFALDLHERSRCHDTLVYATAPFEAATTLLGESSLDLFVAADAPDADICAWLADRRADGRLVMLGFGQLRLRYHRGFETECLLEPGVPVRVSIPLTHVGHRFAPGHSLCLLVSGSNFPLLDPNPHSDEPIASATAMRPAVQTIFHDSARRSRLIVPVLTDG